MSLSAHGRRIVWRTSALVTIALGIVNFVAYYAGVISEAQMNSITNALSWLALTLTLAAGEEAAKKGK